MYNYSNIIFANNTDKKNPTDKVNKATQFNQDKERTSFEGWKK